MLTKKILIAALLSTVIAQPLFAKTQAPTEPVYQNSDNLNWFEANNLPGAKVAILSGNPERHEFFTARVKLPANFTIPVHSHPINENETVISGALHFGSGSTFDKDKAQTLAAGSYVSVPAQVPHYSWTDEETIVQISGTGPWGMIYPKKKA